MTEGDGRETTYHIELAIYEITTKDGEEMDSDIGRADVLTKDFPDHMSAIVGYTNIMMLLSNDEAQQPLAEVQKLVTPVWPKGYGG